MHCHATTHHMEGMNILFREASEKIGPVPVGFPTCNKFSWLQQQFDDYLAKSKLLITSTYQNDNRNPDGEVHFQPNDDETEVVKPCRELEGKISHSVRVEKNRQVSKSFVTVYKPISGVPGRLNFNNSKISVITSQILQL